MSTASESNNVSILTDSNNPRTAGSYDANNAEPTRNGREGKINVRHLSCMNSLHPVIGSGLCNWCRIVDRKSKITTSNGYFEQAESGHHTYQNIGYVCS